MIDHDKLREALDQVEKMKSSYLGVLDPGTAYMGVPLHWFDVIMAAARGTLPEPMTRSWDGTFWLLVVHNKVVGATRDVALAETWKLGCVSDDFVIEIKGTGTKKMVE
jgi:hypothetical protein